MCPLSCASIVSCLLRRNLDLSFRENVYLWTDLYIYTFCHLSVYLLSLSLSLSLATSTVVEFTHAQKPLEQCLVEKIIAPQEAARALVTATRAGSTFVVNFFFFCSLIEKVHTAIIALTKEHTLDLCADLLFSFF